MFTSSSINAGARKRSNNNRRHQRRRGRLNGGYFFDKFLKMKNAAPRYTEVEGGDRSPTAYSSCAALHESEEVDEDEKPSPDRLRIRPNGPCRDSVDDDEEEKLSSTIDAADVQLRSSKKIMKVDRIEASTSSVSRGNSNRFITSFRRRFRSSINDEPRRQPSAASELSTKDGGSMTARFRSSSSPTYLRNTGCAPTTASNRLTGGSAATLGKIGAQQQSDEFLDMAKSYSPASRACRLTFLFDPAGSFCYYWSLVVCVAFVYNLWVIIYRYTFDEIAPSTLVKWFCFDYACDLIYVVDIAMQFRTGYLDEGVLQTNPTKLRLHYVNSTRFYLDCLSLLPLDFLYLSLGFRSILRSFRLVKLYKFWSVVEKTERHTNYPNVLRSLLLFHSILLIFHWNACLIYVFRSYLNYQQRGFWDADDNFYNYLNAYYLSCRTLMLIDSLPKPHKGLKYGFVFIIFEQVAGLIMLATVLGHVAGIVANVSAGRKHFQAQLDAVKTYMRLRKVPSHLQRKVIRWFDFWWLSKKYGNDKEVMECLPDKLKAEIAIHVHLDTLKRVEIFQNTEPGFLCELVIRLKPMLFSPGDFICRRGEVGKEMYIVNRGILQVLADDGKVVLATLKAGSYFGEISILNMGTEGNRRTASVVSLGYSDLFCLTKKEIWEVLEDYPAARARLELIANKRLKQKAQKLLNMNPRERLSGCQNETSGLFNLIKTTTDNSGRRRSAPARLSCNPPMFSNNNEISKQRSSDTTQLVNNLSSKQKKLVDRQSTTTTSDSNKAYASNASTLYDVEDAALDDGKRSERTQLISCTSSNNKNNTGSRRSSSNEFKNEAMSSADSQSPCYDTPPPQLCGETIKLTLYDDVQESII